MTVNGSAWPEMLSTVQQESRLILANALVIPCDDQDPFEGSVVVEAGRIADILPGTQASLGPGQVIECRGRSLIPGLIDAHVHIGSLDVDIQRQHRTYSTSEAVLRMARLLEATLLQGYTTVRDAGGIDAGFRRAVAHGAAHGPRLLVSGRPISQTGGHGDFRSPVESGDPDAQETPMGMQFSIADGADAVLRAAREELRRGADQIKIMASGGVASPTDRLDSIQYGVEELRAAVQAAESAGTYVLAHAYTPASIRNCIEAGVRSIEHGNLIDAATAALMAERGAFLVPTLVAYEGLHEEGERQGLPHESMEKLQIVYDAGLESLRVARDAGIKIASGSDLLGPLARHKTRELAIKAEVLGARGALEATTRTNAELLRLEDEVGTITVGKCADLVLVDGQPLDDIRVLADTSRLALIVLGGRLVVNRLS
jgi:imidazolonepropionase-like amidohydrolase